MPRYLAIDWNPPHLNVLGVRTAKGKATAEQSLAFSLPQELTAPTASALGRGLKDSLAQANLAAAPVLFSLPRDQVVFKEISIPFVPAHEEATVVRFQANKEMSEAPGDVVLDYSLFAPPKAGQPTRVQVVIVRKAIVTAVTTLCQSAGLKLAAVVPRPFAFAGLLDRKTSATMSLARGLLVATGEAEAEFCVFVADRLEWTRTFPTGPTLAVDVQRNLMMLSARKSVPEIAKIEVAGVGEVGDLGVPIEPLDPWRDADAKPQNPVPFLAPLGLAEASAKSGGLLVNLADPKQPQVQVDGNARLKKVGIFAAAALVPLLFLFLYLTLSQTRAAVAQLESEKKELEDKWKLGDQDRLDVASLKDWEETTISWLDELHDISARLPHGPKAQGLRVTAVGAAPNKAARRAGAKDPFTGTVTVHGNMTGNQNELVYQFHEAMRKDKHLRPQTPTFQGSEFEIKIDVAPLPPHKFDTPLVVVPRPKTAAPPSTEAVEKKADPKEGKTNE